MSGRIPPTLNSFIKKKDRDSFQNGQSPRLKLPTTQPEPDTSTRRMFQRAQAFVRAQSQNKISPDEKTDGEFEKYQGTDSEPAPRLLTDLALSRLYLGQGVDLSDGTGSASETASTRQAGFSIRDGPGSGRFRPASSEPSLRPYKAQSGTDDERLSANPRRNERKFKVFELAEPRSQVQDNADTRRGAEQQQSPLSLHELNDSIKSLYKEVSRMSRSMCQEIIGEMKQSMQQIIRKEFEGFVKSHKVEDFEEQIKKQKAEDAKQEEVWIDPGAACISVPLDAMLANGQPPQQQERSLEMSSATETASARQRRERTRSASKNQTSASEERPAEAQAAGDQEDYEPPSPLDFDELEKQLKEVDDEVGNFSRKLQGMQPVKDWRLASHAAVKKASYLGLVNYLGQAVETEAKGLKSRLERVEEARNQARDQIMGNKPQKRGSLKKRRSQRFERHGSLLL